MLEKMVFNYEDNDFFGHYMNVSADYDFYHSAYDYNIQDQKKEVKRALDFMKRPDHLGMRRYATILFCDEDGSWDAVTYDNDGDWENNLLTVTHHRDWHDKDEPYKIDTATLRRRIYKELAKLKEE